MKKFWNWDFFFCMLIFLTLTVFPVSVVVYCLISREEELKERNYNEKIFVINKVASNDLNTDIIVEYTDNFGISRRKVCTPMNFWSPKAGDRAIFKWVGYKKDSIPLLERCE